MNRHLPDSEEEIANRYQITATKTERRTLCEAAGGQTWKAAFFLGFGSNSSCFRDANTVKDFQENEMKRELHK